MRGIVNFLCLIVLSVSENPMVQACSLDGKMGFLPENDLKIATNAAVVSKVDEATFNRILDKIEAIYAPEVARYGKKLIVSKLWSYSRVNAHATNTGPTWQIEIYGGLARHPAINADALAHVACHEMGHHLGGAPRAPIGLSAEGQADYFATLKCLRRVFDDTDPETHIEAPEFVVDKCRAAHADLKDFRICVRSSNAAFAVGVFNATLWPRQRIPIPQFDTPDLSRAQYTLSGYGSVQCRLDTSFQGALCNKPVSEELSFSNPTVGACSTEMGDREGYRPLCWYRPL